MASGQLITYLSLLSQIEDQEGRETRCPQREKKWINFNNYLGIDFSKSPGSFLIHPETGEITDLWGLLKYILNTPFKTWSLILTP